MKTILIFVLLGALLGIVAASYIVPPALSWYTEPGGLPHGTQIQALVQIPEVIRYATGRLMRGKFFSPHRWRRLSRCEAVPPKRGLVHDGESD